MAGVNKAVVGLQWGDEGKGSIIDWESEDSKAVVRYNGGDNAGHTLEYEGKSFAVHVMPSGIAREHVTSIIAQGVLVNPISFYNEYHTVARKTGRYLDRDHLMVSYNAHLILPQHVVLDAGTSKKTGSSTGRGIWPAASDKVSRIGIRVVDLLERRALEDKVTKSVDMANVHLSDMDKVKPYDVMKTIEDYGYFLLHFAGNVKSKLKQLMQDGSNILFEGAQGTLLDPELGTYPNTTSTYTARPSVSQVGCYVPIHKLIGVVKTPMSRVGTGPFPTEWGGTDGSNDCRIPIEGDMEAYGDEQKDKEFTERLLVKIKCTASNLEWGAYFGHIGKERGATTKRPRRLGCLDTTLLRYAIDVNGVDELVLTKFDVYSGIPNIPISDRYFDQWGGEVTNLNDLNNLGRMRPHVVWLDGWKENIKGITKWDELPVNAQKYVLEVEKLAGVHIGLVGTGPDRTNRILR